MPRTADTARRKEIALKAFEVIKTRGVYRTTMSEIAAELGMKRPTLYWYFKDFGEIFDAVVGETDLALRGFVLGRLRGVDHPIDTLEALARGVVDFYAGNRDRVIVLFQMWAMAGEVARERIERRSVEFVQPVREQLVARLARGIADGEVAPCDPIEVVDLVLALIDGAHVQSVTRDADPQVMVDAMCRYVLAPLRVHPPGESS